MRLPPQPPHKWGYTSYLGTLDHSGTIDKDIPYRPNQRYLHHKSGEPLTIRFVGTLNATGKTPGSWIGVEYDDASKGKHDGVFQDTLIFEVKQRGAGSFIKYTPEVVLGRGRTFVDAFEERYGHILPSAVSNGGAIHHEEQPWNSAGDAITLGSSNGTILVQAPGLDRVKRKIGKLERLREIGLEGESVRELGASEEQNVAMRERLKGVTSLNLSKNLLSTWNDVAAVTDCLPNLKTLVLNHSRLRSVDRRTQGISAPTFEGITELHLGSSALLPMDVSTIARLFPNLDRLYLDNNSTLESIPDVLDADRPLQHLQSLDISGCAVSDWPALSTALSQLPRLESLNISDTPLTSIPLRPPECPAPPHLQTVIWLDARVQLLPDLDALQTYLPHLSSLRFSPPATVFSPTSGSRTSPACFQLVPPGVKEQYEQTTLRPMIIAKFPSLTSLNSTPISKQERRDSEVWYISQVKKLLAPEYPETNKDQWGQFDRLCVAHDMGTEKEVASVVPEKRKTSALKSKMLTLQLLYQQGDENTVPKEVSILPSAAVHLLTRKIEKAVGFSGIAIWTTRKMDNEIDKVAMMDSGKVGDWLEDGDVVWVESA